MSAIDENVQQVPNIEQDTDNAVRPPDSDILPTNTDAEEAQSGEVSGGNGGDNADAARNANEAAGSETVGIP